MGTSASKQSGKGKRQQPNVGNTAKQPAPQHAPHQQPATSVEENSSGNPPNKPDPPNQSSVRSNSNEPEPLKKRESLVEVKEGKRPHNSTSWMTTEATYCAQAAQEDRPFELPTTLGESLRLQDSKQSAPITVETVAYKSSGSGSVTRRDGRSNGTGSEVARQTAVPSTPRTRVADVLIADDGRGGLSGQFRNGGSVPKVVVPEETHFVVPTHINPSRLQKSTTPEVQVGVSTIGVNRPVERRSSNHRVDATGSGFNVPSHMTISNRGLKNVHTSQHQSANAW